MPSRLTWRASDERTVRAPFFRPHRVGFIKQILPGPSFHCWSFLQRDCRFSNLARVRPPLSGAGRRVLLFIVDISLQVSSEPVIIRVGVINWFAHRYFVRRLEADGLISPQFGFLRNLHHRDGVHLERIAADMLVDRGVISRSARDPAEAGFVRRERDPLDLRAYQVTLTVRGRSMGPLTDEAIGEFDEALVAGFPDAEKEARHGFLARMVANSRGLAGSSGTSGREAGGRA